MNTKETLLIIIVTFNSESQILNCIRSIFGSKADHLKYRIAIIDNNSTDKTVKIIKESYVDKINDGSIRIIENNENIGFSRAVNLGVKLCISDYYLLLNPDMYLKPSTLNKVVLHSRNNQSSIIGVSTVNQDGHRTGSYFRFPNIMVAIFDFTNLRKLSSTDFWHKYFYYEDIDIFNSSKKEPFKNVDVVSGGFMMIKRSVVESVGYLDERYFMYLEDVDYCLSAKNAGFNISVCNERLTHIGGASSNNRDKVNHVAWMSSRKKYFLKNYGLIQNLVIQPIFLVDDLIILLGKLIKS